MRRALFLLLKHPAIEVVPEAYMYKDSTEKSPFILPFLSKLMMVKSRLIAALACSLLANGVNAQTMASGFSRVGHGVVQNNL